MTIIKQITQDERDTLESIQSCFIGYCNVLGYCAKAGGIDTDLFDKKWAEAVSINQELERLKIKLGEKYYPDDGEIYPHWEFDFKDCKVIYTNEK